jgi:hypothetical protein
MDAFVPNDGSTGWIAILNAQSITQQPDGLPGRADPSDADSKGYVGVQGCRVWRMCDHHLGSESRPPVAVADE